MLDVLRAELERLFDTDQLRTASTRHLGLEPAALRAASTKSALSSALVDWAVEQGAVEALADLVMTKRQGADKRIEQLRVCGYLGDAESIGKERFSPYAVERQLGASPTSTVLQAHSNGEKVRIRTLRKAVLREPAAVQRYLVATRLAADLDVVGLPRNVHVWRDVHTVAVVHEMHVGEPLQSRLGRPTKLSAAWFIVRGVLEALCALHQQRIVHGALHPSNVLVDGVSDSGFVTLLDTGTHYLRLRELIGGVAGGRVAGQVLAYAAPEQLVGELPTPRSDVYAFGLLLHAILTGKPPFPGEGAALAAGRFRATPEPVSLSAPRGWIVPELDELMMALLDEDPRGRPADAEAVLDVLEAIAVRSRRFEAAFPDEAFETHLAQLVEEPADEMTAALLEGCIEKGGSPSRVAEAFLIAADRLPDEPGAAAARRRLLLKSAFLYEVAAQDANAAALAYRRLLDHDPQDDAAWEALERVLRRLGRYEQVVELLVERADRSDSCEEKARALMTVGDLLATKLDDSAQAVVAYTHALIQVPTDKALMQAIERLAGSDRRSWQDVLETCAREAAELESSEVRNQLLLVMGHWYRDRLARLDASLQCYREILATDPAHDPALSAVADLWRHARQWGELAEALLARANGAVTPSMARDLRAEAASLLVAHLQEPSRAMSIYEAIMEEDPLHAEAGRALSALYLGAGRLNDYVHFTRARAELAVVPERHQLLFELARVYEARVADIPAAIDLYEQIVREDRTHIEALGRLDGLYAAAGKHEDLLRTLSRQLDLSVTRRQRVALLRRMARVYSTELGDDESAAATLERLLDVDSSDLQTHIDLARHHRVLQHWGPLAWTLERHAAHLLDPEAKAETLLELGALAQGPLGEPALAIDAFERVRALRPKDATALAALASLQAMIGDQGRAAEVLEALADAESDPARRADYRVKAGEILFLRGEIARAKELFTQALEAIPGHVTAASKLHATLLAMEEPEAAVQVLERTIPNVQDDIAKADLSAELGEAQLLRKKPDTARAHAAATFAVEHDPKNPAALLLLAELLRDRGAFEQAVLRYRELERLERSLQERRMARFLGGYAESLAKIGDKQHAARILDRLLDRFGRERNTLVLASRVAFLIADDARAVDLASAVIHKHGRSLSPEERAECLYHRGESLRRLGRDDDAVASLEQAASVLPRFVEPLRSLSDLYRARRQWTEAHQTLYRVLQRVDGDARIDTLLEIGSLSENEMSDRDAAARTYLAALGERPGDRRILVKLAQLHHAERDWARLIDAILKLVELADDPHQQARYLETAARVACEELGDLDKADELLGKAVALDRTNRTLVEAAFEMKIKVDDAEGAAQLLRDQIRAASSRRDAESVSFYSRKLAALHISWQREGEAIAVLEACSSEGERDPELDEMLLELYERDPIRYLDRAVELARVLVAAAPHRPDPYRIMRRMYAAAKRRDATWLSCQALVVLGAAEVDETMYFKRHRVGQPIASSTRISEPECSELIEHPFVDLGLSRIFRLIEPSVIAARAQTLTDLGLDEQDALAPATEPGGLVCAIYAAAEVLGVSPPLLFENPRAQVAVTMVPADRPVLLLAPDVVGCGMPAQQAAFIAASHLCYFRNGYYVRALVPSLTLKAWLLAATKMVVPSLPVAPDLEGLTREAQAFLQERLTGAARDRLARAVHDVLRRGGRVEIARWTAGVDLSSDRVGFVLSDDLPACLAVIASTENVGSTLTSSQRGRALLEYSISRAYLTLRDRLRFSVDWREMDDLPLGDDVESSRTGPATRRD